MKLLVIVRDASGSLHIEATRAPDLRRREISQLTGKAELIFCAAPPAGVSAEQVAMELRKVLKHDDRTAVLDRTDVLRQAAWHVYVLPAVKSWTGRWRRRWRHQFGGRSKAIAQLSVLR